MGIAATKHELPEGSNGDRARRRAAPFVPRWRGL
jgi:hypothetical protein